jgi:hypothetical protein
MTAQPFLIPAVLLCCAMLPLVFGVIPSNRLYGIRTLMIDIANGCVKRMYTSDVWRKRCVTPHYFLRCAQRTSEGLGLRTSSPDKRPWEG